MRVIIVMLFAVALVFLIAPSSYGQSQDGQTAKKENIKLTAQLLISELKDQMKSFSLTDPPLYAEIQANKDKHIELEKSKAATLDFAAKNLATWYDGEAKKILKRLDDKKPVNQPSWFSEKEKTDLLKVPTPEIEGIIKSSFDKVYGSVRSKVCTEQWNRLSANAYPTESECETLEKSLLRQNLLDRLLKAQSEPIFQENRTLLGTNVVDPIVADIDKQKEAQKQIVAKADGGNALLPKDAGANIEQNLTAYREQLTKEKVNQKIASKVYDSFPSVKESIPKRAEEIAAGKFAGALDKMEFPAPPDELKKIIKENFAGHVSRDASFKACTEKYQAALKKQALEKYVAEAPVDKKAEIQSFAEKCLTTDAKAKSSLDNIIAKSLKGGFEKARQEASDDQFKELFGPLATESWRPTEADIDSHFSKVAIEIIKPLEVPGISAVAVDAGKLLEETVQKVLEKEKLIIAKGLGALRSQGKVVETVEAAIKQELEKSTELPSEEVMIKQFTEKVVAGWSASTPPESYKELFARIKNDIEVRAKALLPREQTRREEVAKVVEEKKKQEDQKAVEDKQKASEGKEKAAEGKEQGGKAGGGGQESSPENGSGGGGAGGGAGGGGGGGNGPGKQPGEEDLTPDLIIDMDYVNNEIQVKLIFTSMNKLLEFNLAGSYKKEQLDKISEIMLAWLKSAQTSNKKDLYVLTRIFSREISYGTVYDFRECLDKAVQTAKIKELKVHWFDKLFSGKEDKGTKKIPDGYRNRSMPLSVMT